MDLQSLSAWLTKMGQDRVRGFNMQTGEPEPWQPYNIKGRPEQLAPSPNSIVGRPDAIAVMKDRYAKAISDGRFDEADAIARQLQTLQNPNSIPEGGDYRGAI